jgi:hypothetical protein
MLGSVAWSRHTEKSRHSLVITMRGDFGHVSIPISDTFRLTVAHGFGQLGPPGRSMTHPCQFDPEGTYGKDWAKNLVARPFKIDLY